MRSLKMALIISLLVALAAVDVIAKDKKRKTDSGMFLIPAKGLVNIKAGSLETRFCLDYSFDDYLRKELSACSPFSYMRFYHMTSSGGLKVNSEKDSLPFINVFQLQPHGRHMLTFDNAEYFFLQKKRTPPVRVKYCRISGDGKRGVFIKRGEWHNLAVTWEVEDKTLNVKMYIDGELYTTGTFPEQESGIPAISDNDFIAIGGIDLSPASILTYRLSNRARTEEEISAQKPLQADKDTTFFLDGNTKFAKSTKGPSQNIKKFFKSKKNRKTGVMFGNFKIVTTKQGKAIQFFKKLSR